MVYIQARNIWRTCKGQPADVSHPPNPCLNPKLTSAYELPLKGKMNSKFRAINVADDDDE